MDAVSETETLAVATVAAIRDAFEAECGCGYDPEFRALGHRESCSLLERRSAALATDVGQELLDEVKHLRSEREELDAICEYLADSGFSLMQHQTPIEAFQAFCAWQQDCLEALRERCAQAIINEFDVAEGETAESVRAVVLAVPLELAPLELTPTAPPAEAQPPKVDALP